MLDLISQILFDFILKLQNLIMSWGKTSYHTVSRNIWVTIKVLNVTQVNILLIFLHTILVYSLFGQKLMQSWNFYSRTRYLYSLYSTCNGVVTSLDGCLGRFCLIYFGGKIQRMKNNINNGWILLFTNTQRIHKNNQSKLYFYSYR